MKARLLVSDADAASGHCCCSRTSLALLAHSSDTAAAAGLIGRGTRVNSVQSVAIYLRPAQVVCFPHQQLGALVGNYLYAVRHQ